VPAESSTVTVLVLDVFAFLAVLAYASFEARHRSRKQHGALIKTDEKPHQNSIKPKPEAPNMGCQGNLEDGPPPQIGVRGIVAWITLWGRLGRC